MAAYILKIERRKMDLGGWSSGEDLGEVGRGETFIRIYCIKRQSILNNKILSHSKNKEIEIMLQLKKYFSDICNYQTKDKFSFIILFSISPTYCFTLDN